MNPSNLYTWPAHTNLLYYKTAPILGFVYSCRNFIYFLFVLMYDIFTFSPYIILRHLLPRIDIYIYHKKCLIHIYMQINPKYSTGSAFLRSDSLFIKQCD